MKLRLHVLLTIFVVDIVLLLMWVPQAHSNTPLANGIEFVETRFQSTPYGKFAYVRHKPILGRTVPSEEVRKSSSPTSNPLLHSVPNLRTQDASLEKSLPNSLNSPAQQLFINFCPNCRVNAPIPAGVSYEGIREVASPPDSHIAVGSSEILVIVNHRFEIYNKLNPGTRLNWHTFDDWLQYNAPAGTFSFDPRVIYDRWNSRFIMIIDGKNDTTQQTFWFVSVSQTPSALGAWTIFTFNPGINGSTPTSDWADRPDIGVDGNNLFITSNMYDFATSQHGYGKVRAYKLSELYNYNVTQYYDAWDLRNADNNPAFDLRPADRYDSKGDMFLVNAYSSGNLTLWRKSDPFSTALPMTRTNISVLPYANPPKAQQPGITNTLDAGDLRILQAQYRKEGIWAVHSTLYDFGTGSRSAIRLYKIKEDGSGLWQQITFGSPDYYLFFPSFATTPSDDVIVSFSISSRRDLNPGLYASVGYTGRQAQDPPNSIQLDTVIAKVGEGPYTSTITDTVRWGDYSGSALDPTDQATVWIFNQYAKSGNNVSTWIATAKYPQTYRMFLPLIAR